MEKEEVGKHNHLKLGVSVVLCFILIVGAYAAIEEFAMQGSATHTAGLGYEIHCLITFYKNGEKVFQQYHAGSVTKIGMNMTLMKLTGNTTLYNTTEEALHLEWISIGNQGTLDTDSTELPGEWNRTACTQHTADYNDCNFTATLYPDAGPYTADCIGINYETGIGNGALWCYDTFEEQTGIDADYTIVVEFKVSLST